MSQTLIDDRPAPPPDDGQPSAPVDGSDDGASAAPSGRLASSWYRFIHMPVEGWIALIIVGFCVGFIFYQLGPSNLLSNTTPAGGDMGAHVWGRPTCATTSSPRRLTGWTPDWYAGFPAYHFYMVVPSLVMPCSTSCCPTASPSSWSPSAAWSPCRSPPGPSAADRLPLPGRRRCSRSAPCVPLRPQLHDLRRQHRVDDGRRVRLLDQPVARRALPRLAHPRPATRAGTGPSRRCCWPWPGCAT